MEALCNVALHGVLLSPAVEWSVHMSVSIYVSICVSIRQCWDHCGPSLAQNLVGPDTWLRSASIGSDQVAGFSFCRRFLIRP